MKKFIWMILITIMFMMVVMPTLSIADCPEDLDACEQLLDDAIKTQAAMEKKVSDCERKLESCEKDNRHDGDISLADLLAFIPGFADMDKGKQAAIVAVVTAGVAIGIAFIPAGG